MNTISIKLPEAMKRQLEVEARQRGMSRSELVRKSLQRVLSVKRGAHALSCYELMIEGCGVVTNAPSDLSSNRKRMRGYGK